MDTAYSTHENDENLTKFLTKNWNRRGCWDSVAYFYVHGNEPSGSIKAGEFCDWQLYTSHERLLSKELFLEVMVEYLILNHREVLCACQVILDFPCFILSLLELYFYFSENYVTSARKYLCSELTKGPVLLRTETSTCCNNIGQLLESFEEVLKQIRDNYKRKQVSYICTKKCIRNKSKSFCDQVSGS